MTKLLYFEDCYLREWSTTVEKAEGNKVVLKETAFYPEGGGQPTDKGFLYCKQKYKVNEVKKKGEIWHYLDKEGLREGDQVKAELDWDRRYKHMRMHTAQHLLSAIVLERYDASTAGNQIHTDYSRIDFCPFDPTKEDLQFITKRFNELVDQGLKVKKYIVDREQIPQVVNNPKRLRLFNRIPKSIKKIRIVEIEGIDKDPCAGTHVDNTNELGHLKILRTENKGKNTTRLVFELI